MKGIEENVSDITQNEKLNSISLYFPETGRSPNEEAKFIFSQITQATYRDKKLNIYTLREVTPNFIGYLIAVGKISCEDINAFVIEDYIMKMCRYDENGFLLDFPFGFFNCNYAKIGSSLGDIT